MIEHASTLELAKEAMTKIKQMPNARIVASTLAEKKRINGKENGAPRITILMGTRNGEQLDSLHDQIQKMVRTVHLKIDMKKATMMFGVGLEEKIHRWGYQKPTTPPKLKLAITSKNLEILNELHTFINELAKI